MFLMNKIEKSYGKMQVLKGISFRLNPGSALCIAGANATGKTTLLSIAASLQKPDAGSVQFNGKAGFVPQEVDLMETLSVQDNLHLWYAAAGRSRKELFLPESPEEWIGLKNYQKKRVSTLSGGVRKRVSIASALACKPQWLILDEPFTALDLPGRKEVYELLGKLKAGGCGILFTSHDPEAICACADDIAVLKDGLLKESVPLTDSEKMELVIQMLSWA